MSKSFQLRIHVTAAIPAPANAEADHETCWKRQDSPPRLDEPERSDDDEERGRVQHRAHDRPHRLAHGDVLRPDRRREHRVVDLAVSKLPEDVRRVVEGAVHRRRREQRWRDECRVLDGLPGRGDVPDEVLERVDEEEEVEQRLEEAREQDHPGPAVHHCVPLDEQETADARPGGCDERRPDDVVGHRTSRFL